MTTADSLALRLELRKATEEERRRLIDDALTGVGMTHLRDRHPHQFSGGRRRVALARGVVHSPGALLLGEPWSGLDARMRDRARVLAPRTSSAKPVSPASTSPTTRSRRCPVRPQHRLHARPPPAGPHPAEIYELPAPPEVAGFTGRCDLLEGRVGSAGAGPVQVELGGTGRCSRVAGAGSAGVSAAVGLRSARRCCRCAAGEDRAVRVDRTRSEYEPGGGAPRVPSESPVHRTGGEIDLLIRPEDCLLYPVAG